MTYYKAVRPNNGTDFYTGTVQWIPEDGVYPHTVRHPSSTEARKGDHETSLAVSTDPTRLPGPSWPLRLLTVEPVEGCPVIETDEHKRQAVAWIVTGEVEAHLRFGPQGVHVAAFIEAVRAMKPDAARDAAWWTAAWDAAWDAARDAAWDAAWDAARDAAWDAAWDAARDAAWWTAAWWTAAWDAACALIVRDLISREHYDTLTRPLRLAGITVHPDDPEVPAMIRAYVAPTDHPAIWVDYIGVNGQTLFQYELTLDESADLREQLHHAEATARLTCGVGDCRSRQEGERMTACPGPDCEWSEEPTFRGGVETLCLTHDCEHPTQEEDTDDDDGTDDA